MDEVEMPPCDAEEVGTDEEEAETGDIETGNAETEGVETIEGFPAIEKVETMEQASMDEVEILPCDAEEVGTDKEEAETGDTSFEWESVGDIEVTKQLPLPPPSFPCRWTGSCTKTFPDKGQLLDHLRAVHHPKRAQCPACCKGFAYQCDVRRHYARKHKDAPPLCLPVKPKKRPRN